MCDVHNTLVNTILRVYATKELQDKYLPDMSSSKVRRSEDIALRTQSDLVP